MVEITAGYPTTLDATAKGPVLHPRKDDPGTAAIKSNAKKAEAKPKTGMLEETNRPKPPPMVSTSNPPPLKDGKQSNFDKMA